MSKTRHAVFEFPWVHFSQPARRAQTPQWLNAARAVSSHLLLTAQTFGLSEFGMSQKKEWE